MVENPAIGELQWPLSTHSTSRSASALWRAAGSSINDRIRRVCQSCAAHSTATMPCPAAGSISCNRKFVGDTAGEPDALEPRARHDQRVRRSDRAAIGQPLHFQLIELAHAGIGGAAIVDHLDLRKQPPRIGGAPHRVGADLETLAARVPDLVDRHTRPQHQHVARPDRARAWRRSRGPACLHCPACP